MSLVSLFISNILYWSLPLVAVSCPELSIPLRGSMDCQHPLGPYNYQSTCNFTCDEGYELVPSSPTSLQCGATRLWNGAQPQCSGKTLTWILWEVKRQCLETGFYPMFNFIMMFSQCQKVLSKLDIRDQNNASLTQLGMRKESLVANESLQKKYEVGTKNVTIDNFNCKT